MSKTDADIWAEIVDRLERGERIAFAVIATRDGSAPRSAGAKMLVGADGLLAGTVGGGSAEARAIAEAKLTLEDGKPRLFEVDMGGSALDGADLICGGRVGIFLQRPEPGHLDVYRALRDRMRDGLDSVLLIPVRESGPPFLVTSGEETSPLDSAALAAGPEGTLLFEHDGREYILEPLPAPVRLVIEGGGHVSLALAELAAKLGFDVAVLDDRAEFVAPARFPFLDPRRLLVVPEFRDCLEEKTLGFPVVRRTFIAILTRGHAFDREALADALRTPAGYIGMIGSRRKRNVIYDRLLEDGFTRGDLERVHSPIGLSIGAETPAEIAVAIAAELIAARAALAE